MNDFLQSIRGHQKDKRTPKTRRSVDHGNFNTAPNFPNQGNYQSTRAGNIKRPATRGTSHVHLPGDELQPSYAPSLDPFDVMLDMLDVYTKNQEMMITVQEKRIIAEERKAIALEEIAEYLRVITMPSFHEKSAFKKSPGTSQEPISSDFDAEPDGYDNGDNDDESDMIPFESLKKDEMLKTEVFESEPVEDEIVDDEYVDTSVVDAEYVDTGSINTGKESFQDVEYSIKPSLREFTDKDKSTPVKVIRRRRAENKGALLSSTTDDSRKISPDISEPKAEAAVAPADGMSAQQEKIQAQRTEESLLPRDEVIAIINSMRARGKTFDEVAQHLISLGQPTFSGRGVWHAQTIHRICTRNERKAALISKRAPR